MNAAEVNHPLALAKQHWPHVSFYREQREGLKSLVDNVETVIVSANKMGKDFMAGYAALSFFWCPQMYFPPSYVQQVEAQRVERERVLGRRVLEWEVHTRRVVTTSVKDDHLRVLWAEIGDFVRGCKTPLLADKGGPFVFTHRELRFKEEMDLTEPKNYLIGRVSEKGEGMAGHHAAYTMIIGDECSGLANQVYVFAQGWAKRHLYFGNPHECQNFWREMVNGGDLESRATA